MALASKKQMTDTMTMNSSMNSFNTTADTERLSAMNDLKNDENHYGSLKVKSFESVGDSSATNNTGSLNINDILQQIKVESQSHECMHDKSLAEI